MDFKNDRNEKGQGLVEYALILVLIAIVVIVAMTTLGDRVSGTFDEVNSGLGGNGAGAQAQATATEVSLSPGCAAINGYNNTYWGDMWPGSSMEYNAGETVTFTLSNPSNLDVAFRSVPYNTEFGRTTNSSYSASYTIPTTQDYRWWVDIYVQANITVSISCSN